MIARVVPFVILNQDLRLIAVGELRMLRRRTAVDVVSVIRRLLVDLVNMSADSKQEVGVVCTSLKRLRETG